MIKAVKEIAKILAKLDQLKETIEKEYPLFVDMDVDFITAEFVSLSKKDLAALKDGGKDDPEFYYKQWKVGENDDWFGHIFFKTDVPGQFVKCNFSYDDIDIGEENKNV